MGRVITASTKTPLTTRQADFIRRVVARVQRGHEFNCEDLSDYTKEGVIAAGKRLFVCIKVSTLNQDCEDAESNSQTAVYLAKARQNERIKPVLGIISAMALPETTGYAGYLQETSFGDADALLLYDLFCEISRGLPALGIHYNDEGVVPLGDVPVVLKAGKKRVDWRKMKSSWLYWLKHLEAGSMTEYFRKRIEKVTESLMRQAPRETPRKIREFNREFAEHADYFRNSSHVENLCSALEQDMDGVPKCKTCGTEIYGFVGPGVFSSSGLNTMKHLSEHGVRTALLDPRSNDKIATHFTTARPSSMPGYTTDAERLLAELGGEYGQLAKLKRLLAKFRAKIDRGLISVPVKELPKPAEEKNR